MAKFKGDIDVDIQRCKGCGLCINACPTNALGMSEEVNDKGYPYATLVSPDSCIGCASCGIICPDGCITVYKKKL